MVEQGPYETAAVAICQDYQHQIDANQRFNGFKDLEIAYINGEVLAWREFSDDLTEFQRNSEAIEADRKAIALVELLYCQSHKKRVKPCKARKT